MMRPMLRILRKILIASSAAAIFLAFSSCKSAQSHSDSTILSSSDNDAKRVLKCTGRSKDNIAITLTAAISERDSLQLNAIDYSPSTVPPLTIELQRMPNKGTMAVYSLPIDKDDDPDIRIEYVNFSFPIEILTTSIPDYSKTFKGIYSHHRRDLDNPVRGYERRIGSTDLVCRFSRSPLIYQN